MASVTLEGIGKRYGDKQVLRDLSLTIHDGECFTLLGPSGCGKTVLLRCIAGFETPEAGCVRIGGAVMSGGDERAVPPNERGLGVVFQDYAVWPHMSVFDNIAYPLKLAGENKTRIRERVGEAIAQVNLAGMEDRLPSQLSGGQQQRVALARALTAQPSLLLLDEPLCNLDAHLREEMRFEIKELQKNLGITVLYVTHDQEIALAIADRMAIMDAHGAIRQIGAPTEVYENPADSFVFRFLGMANFLHVTRHGAVCLLAEGGQTLPAPPPAGEDGDFMAGFRPTDVRLTRQGEGLRGVVRRVSFLGAETDFRIEVDGQIVRTQLDTHQALTDGLLFAEGDACVLGFHGLHWFHRTSFEEGR
jgi:iron(III) transport system ATP-binding protein